MEMGVGWRAAEVERLVMHETHYFYLGQAESGAELQSIFCLSSSAALIAQPLPRSAHSIRGPLSSVPFSSVLN